MKIERRTGLKGLLGAAGLDPVLLRDRTHAPSQDLARQRHTARQH